MHVRIYTPAEDVLAGRILETVRSAVPDADVTVTTDLDEYTAIGGGEVPPVSIVCVSSELDPAAFDATGPTLALVQPGGSVPDRVPRVTLDSAAPDQALASLRAWLRAVAGGESTDDVGGISLGRVAGAAAAGGLAGFLLGGLLGDDGEPPLGGDFI